MLARWHVAWRAVAERGAQSLVIMFRFLGLARPGLARATPPRLQGGKTRRAARGSARQRVARAGGPSYHIAEPAD